MVSNARDEFIGVSSATRLLVAEIEHAAESDAKVLITGESGVGKEIAARLIHRRSTRSGKPIVTINCAGIPEALLESELFGHTRGNAHTVVNVRVIAATHRCLAERIASGDLREDLYYRLNVINIAIPPLRARPEDIPVLLRHFFTVYSRTHQVETPYVSSDALTARPVAPRRRSY